MSNYEATLAGGNWITDEFESVDYEAGNLESLFNMHLWDYESKPTLMPDGPPDEAQVRYWWRGHVLDDECWHVAGTSLKELGHEQGQLHFPPRIQRKPAFQESCLAYHPCIAACPAQLMLAYHLYCLLPHHHDAASSPIFMPPMLLAACCLLFHVQGEESEEWDDFLGSYRPRFVDTDDAREAVWATDEFESDEDNTESEWEPE